MQDQDRNNYYFKSQMDKNGAYARYELSDLDPYEQLNIEIRMLIEEMKFEKRIRDQKKAS